nr:MAG TPA: Tail tape measure [Caudoviricetes sp.]
MSGEEQQILSIKVRYEDAIYGIVRYKEKLAELSKAQEQLKADFKDGKVSYDEYATSLVAISEQTKTHKATIRELSKEVQNNIKTEREQEGSLRALRAELSNATKEFDSLSKAERNSVKGKALKEHINEITDELKKAEEETQRFNRNVGNYEGAIKSALGVNSNFATSIMTLAEGGKGLNGVFNGAIDSAKAFGTTLLGFLSNPVFLSLAGIAGAGVAFKWFFDYNKGILESTRLTREFLGLTGDSLKAVRDEIQATADTYGKDFKETLEAVDVLTSQYGITTSEALKIINDGFQSGADLNGDMIDKIKQYAPAFHDANISGQELVATIQQTRSGIFSDSGLALIQMGSKKIREMSDATAEALDNIGINSKQVQKDLQDGTKSTFDVIKEISTRMKEIPQNSKEMGAVLKDVFGRQGANAGLKMIEQLDTMNIDLEKLKETTGEWGELMNEEKEANEELNKTMSALFDMSDKGFEAMLAQLKLLSTKAITEVLKGLISMINYFIDLYNESMLFRGAIQGTLINFKNLWNGVKLIFNLIVDGVKGVAQNLKGLAQIIEGIATLSFSKVKEGFLNITGSYTKVLKEGYNDIKAFGKDTANNYINGINEVIKNKKVNHIEIPTYIAEEQTTQTTNNNGNGKALNNNNKKKGAKEKKISAEEMAKKEAEAIRKAEDLLSQLIEQTSEQRRNAIAREYDRQIEDVKRRLELEKGLTIEARKALNTQIVLLEQVKEKKLLEFDNITSAEAIKRKQVYYQNMLSAVEKGTKAEYELKLKSINSAYQLELLEAKKQVMNEEEKAELLNSITEKFYQQQLDAQKEFKNKMIDEQAKEIKERFETEILKTDLNGNNDFAERLEILKLELQQRQELLDNAQQREGESIEEFNLRKLHLAKDAKDKENEISSEVIGHRIQELESLRNVIGGVSDVVEAFGAKNKALAQASKMVALAEIAINTGVAISSGIKASVGVPFPKNLVAIATTISQVLSGVATAIRTVKSAKFATGGLVTGPGSGTSDSIHAQLSNGESVLTANATSMFAPALSAFNQIGGGVPIMNNNNSQQQIGEEFLARAVARGMASAPRPIVSVEEISKASNRVETIERLSTLN